MEPAIPDTKTNDMIVPRADIPADFAPPAEVLSGRDNIPEDDEYLRQSMQAEKLYTLAIREMEKGIDRQSVAHLLRAAVHAEMAREWHLAARALHAVGDIFRKNGPERNLERALRMYRRAIAAYEQCGHFDEASNLEYQVCNLRLWHARELKLPVRLRIEMFLYWATAGFGFRPMRVLGSGVVMILTFAIIYWATGGIMSSEEDPITDFGSAAYFSGSTFLTTNYGDLLPARHVRWVTVVEGLTGLTMSSFFVVVLANRLRH
jgi:hypothetical protein